jgi:DNA-directed RNA polymerase subunit RPC12/RpoP
METLATEETAAFKCQTCGKSFSRKDFLARHELNHKNVRPFRCEDCNLGFTRRDMLRKHFKSISHARKSEEQAAGVSDVSDVVDSIKKTNTINDHRYITSTEESNTTDAFAFQATTGNMRVLSPAANHRIKRTNDVNETPTVNPTNGFKKLRISNFLNEHDKKLHSPPPQPSIIRPSSSSGTLSGGSVNVNFGSLVSTKKSEANPQYASHFSSSRQLDDNSSIDGNPESNGNETPDRFLSLLDMSGGFIDNLLWLFTDNASDNTLSETLASYSEGEVVNVDAAKRPDIYPVTYQPKSTLEIHEKMFGHRRYKMNETTRLKVIEIFDDIEALKSVYLSRFDEFLDLYWFNFAQTFPIIHQVTFNPNKVNIYLLIAVLIIGMAHTADRLEYKLSIDLNKKFRTKIRDIIGQTTELSLPILQALILQNFSAKNFGDMKLHQMAQIDHGSILLYLKFGGLIDTLTEPVLCRTKDSTEEDLCEQWQNWIYYETRKRTVFFEYICDTQHITFSGLDISSFDIQLELPCSDEVWNASNPLEFFSAYQKQPIGLVSRSKLNFHRIKDDLEGQKHRSRRTNSNSSDTSYDKVTKVVVERYIEPPLIENSPQSNDKTLGKWPNFTWSLKSLMMEYKENQKDFSLNCYSLFTRYIMLHSLSRVCSHMRGHGLLDLGIISQTKINEYLNKLEIGFAAWKGYFDLHIKLYDDQVKLVKSQVSSNLNGEEYLNSKNSEISSQVFLNNYGPSNACWACLSFFYTGLFTLYCDNALLSKFALHGYNSSKSTSSQNPKDLKELEHERNNLMVEQWAKSSNAAIAVVEACKFLSLIYEHEETINTYSHIPATVVIATFIIWCYELKAYYYKSPTKFPNGSKDNSGFSTNMFFDRNGNVIHERAREKAHDYFGLITGLAKDSANDEMGKDGDEAEHEMKLYEKRQYGTTAVCCYSLYLLSHCKWSYSIDLVRKLEHIVSS